MVKLNCWSSTWEDVWTMLARISRTCHVFEFNDNELYIAISHVDLKGHICHLRFCLVGKRYSLRSNFIRSLSGNFLFQIIYPLQLLIQNHIFKVNSTSHIFYLYFLDQSHIIYYTHLIQLICEQPLFLSCVIFWKWTSNLKQREYPFHNRFSKALLLSFFWRKSKWKQMCFHFHPTFGVKICYICINFHLLSSL